MSIGGGTTSPSAVSQSGQQLRFLLLSPTGSTQACGMRRVLQQALGVPTAYIVWVGVLARGMAGLLQCLR